MHALAPVQVHPACLQQWIETRPHSNRMECELCHEQYAVQFLRRMKCDSDHMCTFASISHMVEAIVLVFTVACIILLVRAAFASFCRRGLLHIVH